MVQGQLAPVVHVVDWQVPAIRRAAVALGAALLALNVLDILVTDLIVGRLGGFEANPLMSPMIGTPAAMSVKVGFCLAVIVLATRITSRRMMIYLRIAVALYLFVAVVNVGQAAYFVL